MRRRLAGDRDTVRACSPSSRGTAQNPAAQASAEVSAQIPSAQGGELARLYSGYAVSPSQDDFARASLACPHSMTNGALIGSQTEPCWTAREIREIETMFSAGWYPAKYASPAALHIEDASGGRFQRRRPVLDLPRSMKRPCACFGAANESSAQNFETRCLRFIAPARCPRGVFRALHTRL